MKTSLSFNATISTQLHILLSLSFNKWFPTSSSGQVTVKPRFNGLMRKCNCPLLENVRYSKTRNLPSVDVQYTFWLKSLYCCYIAETYLRKISLLQTYMKHMH